MYNSPRLQPCWAAIHDGVKLGYQGVDAAIADAHAAMAGVDLDWPDRLGAHLLGLHWHQSNRAYLDIGFWGDQEFLGPNSFYAQEGEEFGLTYRWTRAHNTLLIRGFAPVRNPWLILDVGGLPASAPAPRTLRLTADQAGILDVPIQAEARRYHLLLPADALVDSALDLTLESETSRAAPDPRDVGIRLDGLALAWPDAPGCSQRGKHCSPSG